ncbi:MAG: two-component system chemotaxis response regulator CheY [Flavobacteriales bacterium]|jgi:two-component system chemotaxis response regulator CheY
MTKRSIFVVDDQLAIRRMFKALFIGEPYEVDMAEDGLIAYQAATAKRYDLILTDYHMPNCNGIELITRLRKLSMYNGVPILVVSTESNRSKKDEGRKVGANGWIIKPVDKETLMPAVRKMLGD